MKRLVWAIVLVSVLTAGTTFAIAYWLRCRACATPVAAPIHDATWLTQAFNLTGEQAGKVQALEQDFRAVLGTICEQHCRARADLAAALAQSPVDPAVARASVDRMCVAEAASERATLEHILKVRAVLTPDQQTRYGEALQTQLTGACPMRVHQP